MTEYKTMSEIYRNIAAALLEAAKRSIAGGDNMGFRMHMESFEKYHARAVDAMKREHDALMSEHVLVRFVNYRGQTFGPKDFADSARIVWEHCTGHNSAIALEFLRNNAWVNIRRDALESVILNGFSLEVKQ